MSATTAAAPAPSGIAADLENPTDVIRTVNFVTQGLTLFFIPAFVLIRFVSKYRSAGFNYTVDDCKSDTSTFYYLILTSSLLMVGYCMSGIVLSIYGGGYHQWEVPADHMEAFFKAGYAATIFYAPMALFVKLCLLTIIARVFSPYKKTVIGIYVFEGFLICYYISQLVVKIRICWPISAYWTGDASKCLDQAAVIMADSIISVISDVIILILPLPLTWSLQLPQKKKLRVAGMLCVGGLATAFSAWRLHLIQADGKSPDQTIIFTQVVLSGNAEAGIGLICACLPAAAALFWRITGSTSYGSQRNPGRSYQLSGLNASRSAKERGFQDIGAIESSDEATLVTHAQESQSREFGHGIMRKVEVSIASSEERPRTEKSIDV
ncbi:hypothetical protein BS50DRAFT_551637 [Corynespora cassiicola Philippines]|uniref:Rhodopsin domain-containing protein n=1 Tax=Corynespora cassiicola Philippines TaxID=1448308 RepID=A0A2T2NS80_CORCC|nr:hypothetical protein BS50DRAFT_551637 [Corynespora cassiicola Philippines]